jgi:hypothetical protein
MEYAAPFRKTAFWKLFFLEIAVWGPLVRSLHEIPVRIREALN